MAKNKNRARAGTRDAAPKLLDLAGHSDSISSVNNQPVEYHLHIDETGVEHRYPSAVLARGGYGTVSLDVTVIDGMETTRTVNIENRGTFGVIIFVKPRGDGWFLHDTSSDNFTVWKRRRVRP